VGYQQNIKSSIRIVLWHTATRGLINTQPDIFHSSACLPDLNVQVVDLRSWCCILFHWLTPNPTSPASSPRSQFCQRPFLGHPTPQQQCAVLLLSTQAQVLQTSCSLGMEAVSMPQIVRFRVEAVHASCRGAKRLQLFPAVER